MSKNIENSETKEKEDNDIITQELVNLLKNDIPSEQLLTEFNKGGQSNEDKTEFTKEWFPGSEEWQGKTDISYHQAKALALVRNLHLVFPEIDDLELFLNNTVTDYEMYLTSVDGLAREQQASILKSLFGGSTEESENTRNMLMTALAGKKDNDND